MADLVGPRLYGCSNCGNHVSLHDDIVSKAFQGKHGRAFMFSHVMNITVGAKEDRHLLTGLHTVDDVSCGDCHEVQGWNMNEPTRHHRSTRKGSSYWRSRKLSRKVGRS